MLSAMNLSIICGDTPQYWQWMTIPESRTITSVLSPRTRYSAYIVLKEVDECYGFVDVPFESAVGVVGQEPSRRFICFDVEAMDEWFIRRDGGKRNVVKPEKREDRWMEIELGEFINEGGGLMNSDEIEMSVLETELFNWKSGLIIQRIEIRPAISPPK